MPTIRPSTDADVPAFTAIYTHHVLHGTGTFEIEPPSQADMASRRADVLSKGLGHQGMVPGPAPQRPARGAFLFKALVFAAPCQ